MKIRLNSAVGFSPMRATSRSMQRIPSHRSMHSQKSTQELERGWSTKFKKARALEENPTPALYRPVSQTSKRFQSPESKKHSSPQADKRSIKSKKNLIPALDDKEKIEYRKLKRRFGN